MKKFLFMFVWGMSAIHGLAQTDTSAVPGTFQLGEVTIRANIDKEAVESGELRQSNSYDLSTALNSIPSVTFNITGEKNENTIFIRGFDIRGIPVYLDGVPVSAAYDGYVDLARFTTYDISRIEISKGFTSMMYGNNALGGVINLVGMKPAGKYEVEAGIRAFSGKGISASLNAGGSFAKFYIQTGVSMLSRKYLPLSAKFDTLALEKDHNRDNSDRDDLKATVKIGFTPNESDEYSISYMYLEAGKGNPVYLGADDNIRIRYWKWPRWDKQSIYFISKTAIGKRSQIKTRLFYDMFENKLRSYDDDTYSTQEKKSSFNSYYKDQTFGSQLELSHDLTTSNNLKFSLLMKNESHREHNDDEPARNFSDNTLFIGLENIIRLSKQLKIIPGLAYSYRKSTEAEDLNSEDLTVTNLPLHSSRSINAQLGSYYSMNSDISLSFNVALKSRFPTMKDRYSYRLGTSLSNPDLKSEYALNLELAADLLLSDRVHIKPEIYYSRLSNTIQMVDNVQGDLSQLQNTGKSYFAGADMSLKFMPLEKLDFSFFYSYIRRHNLSNPDILFTDVPESRLLLNASWAVIREITLNINGEFNSSRINASDGSRESPSFFVTDVNVIFMPLSGTEFVAGVKNIFDINYTIEEGYPEMGRNFHVSLNYKFRKK